MITLSILIVIALICALVGCLMGLFSLVGLLASLVIGVVLYAAKGLFTYGSWGHFFIAIALCGAVGYVLAFFLLFNPSEYKEIVHMFLSKMKKKTA